MMQIERKKFNISILGENTVGKTSMIQVYFGLPFNENEIPTIGVEHFADKANFDNKEYTFKIFDTAGQERYNSISSTTIRIADGYLLVFSVDQKSSLNKVDYWIKSIEENANLEKKVLILAGNKIDVKERQVSNEEAVNYAKNRNIKYFETSAKTGYQIKEVFKELYNDIYQLNQKLNLEKKESKNITITGDNDIGAKHNNKKFC